MASDVEIVNRALTKLGAERILSLTDDVKNARVMNSMFVSVRDAELRRHNWNFAVKRASLAASTTDPDWGFDNAFPLPSDFLRLLDIDGSWSAVGLADYVGYDNAIFRIETVGDDNIKCIVTDLSAPLLIRYTRRVTDANLMDSAYIEALACRLAAEGCESITQSNSKRDLAMREYNDAISSAILANAIENPPSALADDSWVMSRL